MQFPIVREYKTDIQQKNEENEIAGELVQVPAGLYDRVFVPRHAPFFVKSLRLTTLNGEPLILGEDYDVYKIMPKVTGLTGQGVACLIRFLKPEITDALMDYHCVGELDLLDNTLLNLIAGAINDNRPVWWDGVRNKPAGFPPELHGHSLIYEVMAFQDTIDLLNDILEVMRTTPDLMKVRIDHFTKLVNWYIELYGGMLNDYLDNHRDTYDAHGYTAKQAGLDLVDNFSTATFADIMQARDDQHLRPTELKTLIESYSFNSDEFLPSKQLPIAQYGNTNFIPPNIDGSFEGFGGVSETAGISLENDSSIVILWNRMDGRTRGLYYSVLTDAVSAARGKLIYTGYKYEHPRFVPDGANVDRIVQGSGDEVIMVGDSIKNIYYVGVTNGTLDPTKHVYSKVNLQPLVDAIFPAADNVKPLSLFPMLSVCLMSDWIYIILNSATPGPDPAPIRAGMVYRHFFRVRLADVQQTIDVTPVRQNLTFVNADGTQFTNSPWYKWYDVQANGLDVTKALYTFSPLPCNSWNGNYRSQLTLSAEDPDRKGVYGVKFLSAYYAAYIGPAGSKAFNSVPEITYDFTPSTGVFVLKSKNNLPTNVDFNSADFLPAQYRAPPIVGFLVFTFQGQGLNILPDGRVASSGALGFSGFPRISGVLEVVDSKSRYASVSKQWGNTSVNIKYEGTWDESISSPIESSINVRGLLYRPGVEYYISARKNDLGTLQLYRKAITGKLAIRPEVTNLIVPNVLSRPLTTSIRPVNALPGMGGMTITVPSARLDSFGIEVAESAFCVNAQKRYFDRDSMGNGWTTPVGLDDILLTATHTDRLDADGSVTLVPNIEILYPAAIVELLKNQVQYPEIKNRARQCIVTICDPTWSGMDRFGWLPVVACITYADAYGLPTSEFLYATYVSIQPTYMTQGNRKVATGFTVLDKVNIEGPRYAITTLRIFNPKADSAESPQTTIGPMRAQYYLDGNKLTLLFFSGVLGQTVSDSIIYNLLFTYNDRTTKRWSLAQNYPTSSRGSASAVTPDNGITWTMEWGDTTGGAATITKGTANAVLLGSVYPEVGWIVFFKAETSVVFNGEPFVLPPGSIDLRDIDPNPQNKTFYVYARLVSGVAFYEITQEKRLESNYQLWIAGITTNDRQIITIERFNVVALDGHRVSETKRGNSIPASSGLINAEGQLPWLRPGEILP